MCAEMVLAILQGRKSQTRRLGKNQNADWTELGVEEGVATYRAYPSGGNARHAIEACPYGVPGDRLFVKESHLYRANKQAVIYRADLDDGEAAGVGAMYGGWKSPLFMPRWASRITLEITEIRVERLNEISEADAIAEGLESLGAMGAHKTWWQDYRILDWTNGFRDPRQSYRTLWDSINGKKAPWKDNLWVWVIEFKKL